MLLSSVRILSLDVGEKRIGVALSDSSRTIAQALKVINTSGSQARDIAEIKTLVNMYDVSLIVVGLPKNLDGSLGEKARRIMQFSEKIQQATGVSTDLWDERFTTNEAHRIYDMAAVKRKKRRNTIDMLAAQLILQGYLDAQAHE
jgi:putative Holliday junction resolvase